jgi:NAD(P)-dependent dehydrogenase (short-subunit alcohol dehydrogenase family)
MRLKDKVALVTGGASGMGESAARLFAREGAKVAVSDLLEREGAQVVGSINAAGGDAMFLRQDVADEAQWAQTVRAVVQRYGRLNILVNNAGISGAVSDRTDLAYYDKLMAVNARGTFLGMMAAIPEMQKIGGGAIVNLSSISGFIGQEFVHMGYNAAKGAIRLLTKSAAVQYAKSGIRVNSVHPGMLPPMRTSVTSADPVVREKVIANSVPMGRSGRVEEVAYAILFLASDEASYITGTELVVDGGLLAM